MVLDVKAEGKAAWFGLWHPLCTEATGAEEEHGEIDRSIGWDGVPAPLSAGAGSIPAFIVVMIRRWDGCARGVAG
jgi:hypothetical protein